MDTSFYIDVATRLSEGFVVTIEIFLLTLLFSLPLGLVISFGSMSKFKPLKWFVKTVVWIIRGTPLMLQLIVVFYGPGLLAFSAQELLTTGVTNSVVEWVATWSGLERFTAVIVAFSINYSCYFSEIYRGGIESIPKGQYEAGQVLGMTKTQIFFKIILKQVIKHILPPMSNEIITLVKDTSLARVIAIYELIWAGEVFIKLNGTLMPLMATAVFYLLFSGILTLALGKLEKKLDYYNV